MQLTNTERCGPQLLRSGLERVLDFFFFWYKRDAVDPLRLLCKQCFLSTLHYAIDFFFLKKKKEVEPHRI
jgi:hypothetical protein